MEAHRIERKLSAILSADVKGYSRLMGEDEEGTLRTLTAYRQVVDTAIEQHHEGEQIYGDGVNIAARLEALADPRGICISGTAYDQIKNKLALGYEYLGEQTVKRSLVYNSNNLGLHLMLLDDDGFTDQDLEASILNGKIVRRERDSIGRPKYVIEGTALDGRSLTAVAQPFRTRQLVLIITAYET